MTATLPASLARRAVHLGVLAAFAIAQPLFDVLSNSPEFFVVRGSTRSDVVAFGLVVVLLPPLALAACQAVARLGDRRAADALHLVSVALLVALLAVQALKRIDGLSGRAALAGGALLGLAAALVYARGAAARTILTVLAPMPLLVLGLFLVNAPIGELAGTEAAQAARGHVGRPAPVVIVLFDEFPVTSLMDEQREIDPVRYPNFAAFARDATWYRTTTTVHEHTTEAVPAMLTGRYWRKGALPLVGDHPNNLFTLLAGTYRFRVFESVTQLCPQSSCPRARDGFAGRMRSLASDLGIVYLHVLLPDSLTRDLPAVTETWQNFGDDHAGDDGPRRRPVLVSNDKEINRFVGRELWRDQRVAFDGFLAAIQPSERPTVYFTHVMLPHYPWRYLPSGRQYGNALGIDGLSMDVWENDPWLVTQGWQRHLLQVGFVDRLVGELVRRLKRQGLYDRSLIVLTSDHGASFEPGGKRRDVSAANIADIAPVPLLIKRPGQRRGAIVDRHVRTVDIAPTIADLLQTRLTWKVDGRSLLAPSSDEPRKVSVSERDASVVEADIAAVRRGVAETLRRQTAIFGSRRDLYRIGPHRELIGRPVAALRTTGTDSVRAEVDGRTLFDAVDPRSPLSPSHVTGRVEGAVPARGLPLAVAVNGRIAAMTRTFRADGDVRFSAFVPESAFRAGANDVAVFAVARTGRTFELRLLSGAGGAYRLARAAGRELIGMPGGGRATVARGALAGRVEDWFFERRTVRFGGWAADVANGRLPDRIVVFADGAFVYSGTTRVERFDLPAAKANRRLGKAGFVFELPRATVGDGTRLRFFAVRGRTASELTYAEDFPWRS